MLYTALTRTITDSELTHTSADVAKVVQFWDEYSNSYWGVIASVSSSSSVVLSEGDNLPAIDTTIYDVTLVGYVTTAPAEGVGSLLTLTQAKSLLQITDTSKDELISALMPIIKAEICDYCNNDFLNTDIQAHSTGISFSVANGPIYSISSVDDDFTDIGLVAGDVSILGSKYNDGIKTITSVGTGLLISANAVTAEAAENDIFITRVAWPAGIQGPASMLLKYRLEKSGKLENSESLPGGYSVQYKTEAEIMAPFNKWRKLYR